MGKLSGYYIMDSVDLFDTYNCAIVKESYNDIMSYPKAKEPYSNDWFEQDGLDVDLTELFFESKDVTLKFILFNVDKFTLLSNINKFKDALFASGNRIFTLPSINKTVTLRYVESSNVETNIPKEASQYYFYIEVKFKMDKPQDFFLTASDKFINPVSNTTIFYPYSYLNRSNLSFMGLNMYDYGIGIKNVHESLLTFTNKKEILSRTFEKSSGNEVYNSIAVKNESTEVALSVLMVGSNKNEVINNYFLFFEKLTKNPQITFSSAITGKKYNCYYDSQSDLKIDGFNKSTFTIEFTLKLYSYSYGQYPNAFNDIYTNIFN